MCPLHPRRAFWRGWGRSLDAGMSGQYIGGESNHMSRLFRQTSVLALILLWNTAGMYAMVCSSLCAEAAYPQRAAQASLDGGPHGMRMRNGAAGAPSRPDQHCANHLQARKCVTGPSQAQRPEFSYAQPLAVSVTPMAFGFAPGAGARTHSPPGSPSGRSICRKLTLLRI